MGCGRYGGSRPSGVIERWNPELTRRARTPFRREHNVMMHLENLTPTMRTVMVAEIQASAAAGTLWESPRLTDVGRSDFARLLAEAAGEHDSDWLANELKSGTRIKATELRMGNPVKVPFTAGDTLAEGEFNRYYILAVCRTVMSANQEGEVEVYRAKMVGTPRPESRAIEGQRRKAKDVYADLLSASNANGPTALGVPGGPNSGMSVRIPVPVIPLTTE